MEVELVKWQEFLSQLALPFPLESRKNRIKLSKSGKHLLNQEWKEIRQNPMKSYPESPQVRPSDLGWQVVH